MKFTYAYRDHNNERHDGFVVASSKDDAFKQLRSSGIKPFFVAPVPGVWNRILSFGKRGTAIVILSVALVAMLSVVWWLMGTVSKVEAESSSPMTRRQVYGDPALLEKLESENYSAVFACDGDRVLAHFAQPAVIHRYVGELVRYRRHFSAASTSLGALAETMRKDEAKFPDVRTREERELQRIVMWMRGELCAYLANGNGTPGSFLRRLIERQKTELQIYQRVQNELKCSHDANLWSRRNADLRAIGAPTIPMPSDEIEN